MNVDPAVAPYEEAEKHRILKYEKTRYPETSRGIETNDRLEKDTDGKHVPNMLRRYLLDSHPVVFGFLYCLPAPILNKVEHLWR